MGCKALKHLQLTGEITGINRYIVGCKARKAITDIFRATGINRYIVGCKGQKPLKMSQHLIQELIDT